MNEQSGSGQSVGGGPDPERLRQGIEKRLEAVAGGLNHVVLLWPDSHRLDEFTRHLLEASDAVMRARRILREGRHV